MRVFQVMVDTILITLLVESEDQILYYLRKNDENFVTKEGHEGIFYEFGDDYIEKCDVKEVTHMRGIIQAEAH